MNNNRIHVNGDEFNIFLAMFLLSNASKITQKHTSEFVCGLACVSVWVFTCVSVLYLPQVLHAAMYAIKMNAEVFCQPPRTRPCLMRYNPLEAGILLSLFPSPARCCCCSYLFFLLCFQLFCIRKSIYQC